LAIHTAAALAMPGVVKVFTAADVPGERGTGLNFPDLPIFVAQGETTCCVGDFLAMVVADTAFHARQAAGKVDVDYEVLEPVTDPVAALEPDAPQVHPAGNMFVASNLLDTTAFTRGDVDAALARSAHVIEATFATQAVEPAFLEPEACLALPQGNGVKVHTDSQGSIFDQKQIAKVLNLPLEDVEIALAASGGAFGAKEELSIQAQTALAAHLLGCPVKTVLTREQSTQHHVKRHPMTLQYTVGADAEGHLIAVRVRIIGDAGGYAGTSGKCLLRAACHSCGPYRVPHKSAKYAGIGCGIKSTGIGNGTIDSGHIVIRVIEGGRLEILNGYTELGQGVYTATMQAVCEEMGLPADIMTVRWDKDLGNKCGETWASRATTLSCAAAQEAAQKLARDLEDRRLTDLVGRTYEGDCVCNFTTRPGTPEAVENPTTHLTFSYSTQVVILGEDGRLERVVAAHDVGRAINPRLCAEQMEGGVHMGLGYALSEEFTSTNGKPDSLALRDLGIVRARDMPPCDVILIEVPDEVGGYGAKGVGEIGCVSTAGAVAGALHAYDGIRRFTLPMADSPAAVPLLPESRRRPAAADRQRRSATRGFLS
jgi:CO/xanthine dehydrogenase Mo-binding subunit